MFWNNTSCIAIILEKRLLGTKHIILEGTRPIVMNMEGTRPNAADYGGHPAPTGPALPNLINAVSMLKSKSTCLSRR